MRNLVRWFRRRRCDHQLVADGHWMTGRQVVATTRTLHPLHPLRPQRDHLTRHGEGNSPMR